LNKKIVAYLAVPYSLANKSKEIGIYKPDMSEEDRRIRQERFEKVNKVAGKLMQAGFAVISPISQSHPIALQCELPGKFNDFWADIDFNIIIRCDMVIVLCLPGWKDSIGILAEVGFAKHNNIPVMYVTEELTITNG
jgi:nucleoside 2-deoxyribosyltransferase